MKDTANVRTAEVRMVPLSELPDEVPGTSYYMWRNLALRGLIPAIRSGGRGKILVELEGALRYLQTANLNDDNKNEPPKRGIRELGNDKYSNNKK